MIYTVTTVKDTTAHIETFIERNLAAGGDHLLIFLDDAEDGSQAGAIAGPHVTVVSTGAAYWQGRRPDGLNRRQSTNADLANLLLSCLPWADWLFHIDADECLDIDRRSLEQVDPKHQVVRLLPLEAIAQPEWEGEVTHFKRLLTKPELRAVHQRGLIERPTNPAYFRGHLMGKVGVRPSPFLCLSIHHAVTQHGAQLQDHGEASLRMLHYDSHTGEEFVRKWTNLLGGGLRQKRRAGHIAEAIWPIIDGPGSDEDKFGRLMEVFRASRQDDLDALDEMGLLVTLDPARHSHRPQVHSDQQAAAFAALWDLLVRADRRYADRRRPRFQSVALLMELSEKQRAAGRDDLADLLAGALNRR